jgi:hypothetical protein
MSIVTQVDVLNNYFQLRGLYCRLYEDLDIAYIHNSLILYYKLTGKDTHSNIADYTYRYSIVINTTRPFNAQYDQFIKHINDALTLEFIITTETSSDCISLPPINFRTFYNNALKQLKDN